MGTRGLVGFRYQDKDKLTYNHFDSYPEGLGSDVVNELRAILDLPNGFETLCGRVAALQLVNAEEPAQIDETLAAEIAKWRFEHPEAENDRQYWYAKLRDCQGGIHKYLETGYMQDGRDFILDSLFCEWGYIVNCDTKKLEVYRGFIKRPHTRGRYAGATKLFNAKDGYYPCALIAEYAFSRLPKGLTDAGLNKKERAQFGRTIR